MSLPHSQKRILDNFIVVWLDSTINESSTDFQYSINQLGRVVNSIKSFTHADQCIDYLTDIKNEKAFMIVSGTLAEQLMPLIEEIPQLHAIYILSSHQMTHKQWIKDYHKVKDVFIQIEPLCEILKRDVRETDIDLTPISIVSVSSTIDLNQLDLSFMYTQLLKEILLKMEYDEKAKTEFIEFCLVQHVENESALRLIDEFERDYDRPSPIWWYTRECFIYSMLNKALRTQDTEIIIKLGFFLRDLHRQIEHLHSNIDKRNLLTVYRGQGMFNAEFEKIVKSEGGLLSFNSFLSTSIDREVAYARAESSADASELTGVLFQMEINPSISTIPFALLDDVSYFSDSEKEILFSMHTVFRISEMKQIDNRRLWEVKLLLTSDNDEQLKRLTDHMRENMGGSLTWTLLGNLMLKMGELDKAEEIYKVILECKPHKNLANDEWLKNQLESLTAQNTAQSHFDMAFEIFQKFIRPNYHNPSMSHYNIGSLHDAMQKCSVLQSHLEKARQLMQQPLPPNHPHPIALQEDMDDLHRWIEEFSSATSNYQNALDYLETSHRVTTHNSIGHVQQLKGDYLSALSHHEKALDILQKSPSPNHFGLASSHNNLGLSYKSMGEYRTALSHFEKALNIWQKALPPNHPNLAISHNNIGDAHCALGDYSAAALHLKKALEIFQKSVPSNHPDLAMSHNNIGLVHQSMGEYSTALSHLKKALDIWQKSLPPNHPNLALSHNNIGEAHRLIGEYSVALSHYEKTLEIWQKSVPPNHPHIATSYNNIGLVYQSMGEYPTALVHLKKSLEIWQKSLSSNHPDLATPHNNIAVVLQSMGEYSTALSYCEKALEISRKSFPPNHPNLAVSHNNIGAAYQSMKEYSTALSHLEKALEIRQESLPSNHPDLALAHNNIGVVYQLIGDYLAALSHFEKALEIWQKSLPPNCSDLVRSHSNIATACESLHRHQEAIQHALEAMNIATRAFEPTHPQMKMLQDQLKKLMMKSNI